MGLMKGLMDLVVLVNKLMKKHLTYARCFFIGFVDIRLHQTLWKYIHVGLL